MQGQLLSRMCLAAMALLLSDPARAETRVDIGCTAVTDCAAAALAVYDGIFARNGIEASITLIGNNATIPAALVSDSVQIGGLTTPTFLQAVTGGLDLTIVSGASSTVESTSKTAAVIVAPGAGIDAPADFAGKTVGAPGLKASMHILFMLWLKERGVDPRQVNYVEVPFASMGDALKGGSVPAVLAADPVATRIVESGAGEIAGYILDGVPDGVPIIVFSATKEWAESNPEAVERFRRSIAEASEIVNANPERAREAVGRFTNIPANVLANQVVARNDPAVGRAGLDWWIHSMKGLGLLPGDVDAAALIQN